MTPPGASPDFATAHARVCELCDHFDARRAEIMAAGYKEDAARNEFITPFFEALGWDVRNTAHRSVYEKDVVTEKREDIAGTARSADYAFRRPGTHLTAFFVEAKKPSVDIRGNAECYQAVLYGWNASTPLTVLTGFEQLLILDARSEPDKSNASRHVLKQHGSYTCKDYRDPEKFAELWGLLARENVAGGSLDKAAAALPRLSGRIQKNDLFARGSGPVDETFLAQMEVWREKLAKSLKRSNHELDGERLTSLTQRILDRLVFLRFLEDRGIERDVTFASIGKGGSAWRDFLKISRRLDARYNGIIYKSDPDGCEDKALVVDDTVFAAIAEKFAPENSKYLFGQISVTILGSIYERFLGNVIVARDKTAIVEPKPEVRKAGGVYYTPDYIVRYIVAQTVGRCIEGKKPAEIDKLRFADIACGSGSFLVEVFACLIRYHLAWYLADGAEKWQKKGLLRQREIDGDHVLTLAEKRRILLACVYGVDLDPSAVEVTQLSLYLRLMEDESFPSTQLLFDEERLCLLPDLRENIICGNSLIEDDVADLFGLSPGEKEKIRPLNFKWEFRKVFQRFSDEGSSVVKETADDYILLGANPTHGNLDPDLPYKASKSKTPKSKPVGSIHEAGFDAIVGNPPYVRPHNLTPETKEYLWKRYETFTHKADLYCAFIEKAERLLKPGGRFSYIVSKGWMRLNSFQKLRRAILNAFCVEQLIEFGYRVFTEAQVDTMLFVFAKTDKLTRSKSNVFACNISKLAQWPPDSGTWNRIPQRAFESTFENVFDVTIRPAAEAVKEKMRRGPTIGSEFDVCFGLKTGDDSKFLHTTFGLHKEDRPLLRGDDVKRYAVHPKGEFVWYVPLQMRAHRQTARPGEAKRFEQPKVLVKDTSKDFAGTYDPHGCYVKDVLIVIPHEDKPSKYDLRFVTAVINSTALRYYYRTTFQTIHVQRGELSSLPLPPIDFIQLGDRENHNLLATLVDKMLEAKKSEATSNDGVKREFWRRHCEMLDRQIDGLVYELYGLTDEEIALVEGGA